MEYALTATKNEARAGSYYDRIARLYDLTFKLNGYGRSLDQYFANHPLPVSRGARDGFAYSRLAACDSFSSLDHCARSVVNVGCCCTEIALLQLRSKAISV